MTLQELLIEAGIPQETVDAVFTKMKENKIFTASEENLDVRYTKLKDDHSAKVGELEAAKKLIEDLKKNAKGNEELSGKIATYETQVADLQKQLEETKIKSAIKVALLAEKAVDVDYLTYKLEEKLRENGETLTLDENENIKGWGDRLAALKTQFPAQFESSTSTAKKFEPNKLPDPNGEKKFTKADLLKMPYAERAKFQSENPSEYQTIINS
jgi:hypothetical protein